MRVDVVVVHVDERTRPADSRVVHHDVDAAEGVQHGRDHRLAPRYAAHVRVIGDGRAAPLDDLAHDLIGRAGIASAAAHPGADVVDDDRRARGGEGQCVRPPQAAAGARDQRDLACQ